MPTTLTNGIQLPDKGSVDWYSSMQSNYNLIDTHLGDTDVHVTTEDKTRWDGKQGSLSQAQLDAIAQVSTNTSDIATLQTSKANASHTHSSSDITDIGDYATKQYVDNSISGLVDNAPDALNTLNELSAALNDDSNFASTVTTALGAKANSADLATVATSGSYTDLTDKPTINNSTITIQKNGSTVDTFTTNGSAKTINIPVPTKTSDLTNDSNFVDTSSLATVATSGFYNDLDNKPYIPDKISDLIDDSNFVDIFNPAVSSGITSAKVTDYDTHIADTDIHVTTADKNKWNNQTYVFRYSSTALTPSSTNSNTLLDNTDNLKVGDKVIDSSGVLFSVTAIDTQNSTFTIGTALIDLAQDSDVVHKSGNETVAGYKTFSDNMTLYNSSASVNPVALFFKNKKVVIGSTTDIGSQNIAFRDSTDTNLSIVKTSCESVGNTSFEIRVYNKDSNSQTVSGGMLISQTPVNTYISPTTDNAVLFGSSSRRWSKVYATNYYYGSNNVEFSTKFVTTDTNQTISGNKTFSSDLTVANTDTTANIPNLYLRNYKADRGTVETSVQVIQFLDKNSKALTLLESRRLSNGNTSTNILCYNTDDNNNTVSGGVSVIKTKTATNFAPNADNTVTCGRPLAKWSDVQTYQINGLTPSSLSLPATRDNAIDISSYFTNFNNGDTNQYAPTVNGWIYLETTGCNALHCFCTTTGNLVHYGNTVARANDGMAYVTFPVLANTLFKCTWYSNTTITLSRAWFLPCQGNV